MRKASLFVVAIASGLLAALTATTATATPIVVPATADLFVAGLPANVSNCCAGDTKAGDSPVQVPLTLVAGAYLTFTATGGAAHVPNPAAVSPTGDGDTSYVDNDIPATFGYGISGPLQVHLNALGGLFLGPDTPTNPAPAQLSGTTFSTISPQIGQIFFIGDGLTGTGSGAVQTFYVPQGATRLFLGILDEGGNYDNYGSITANVVQHAADGSPTPRDPSAVPEPATVALLFGGLAAMASASRRRRGSGTA